MLLDLWETLLLLWLSLPYTASALPTSSNGDDLSARQLSGSDQAKKTSIIPVQEVDSHWVAKVSIGGQEVLLCIDTGWVSTQAGNSNGRVYAVEKSPTAKPLPDEKFNISFPHSSASGIVVEDTLALSSRSVVLEDFALGVVYQESSGILDSTPTLFESLMPDLQSPIFALNFQSNANDQIGPSMRFGGIDTTKFHGQLASTPIDRSTNRWTVKGIMFSIRGERMDESADMSFDTGGGNHIYAPLSITSAYYSQIPDLLWSSKLGGYNCTIVIPCTSHLPDLEMHIGNGTARIRSEHMKGEPLTGPANPAWNLAYGQLCVPTLQPGGGPYPGKKCLGLRLVGAPFFHENYVVFNQAEPSISYAPYV
ncbi:MAG: hypothetical protein L6R38_007112 [Xanthoria sp. 2 TBL-2021]|nr:MAG: hypothetical protein L6R38_007112 [Xanthoria sp. 2 TBL-2021]